MEFALWAHREKQGSCLFVLLASFSFFSLWILGQQFPALKTPIWKAEPGFVKAGELLSLRLITDPGAGLLVEIFLYILPLTCVPPPPPWPQVATLVLFAAACYRWSCREGSLASSHPTGTFSAICQ